MLPKRLHQNSRRQERCSPVDENTLSRCPSNRQQLSGVHCVGTPTEVSMTRLRPPSGLLPACDLAFFPHQP